MAVVPHAGDDTHVDEAKPIELHFASVDRLLGFKPGGGEVEKLPESVESVLSWGRHGEKG